MSTDADEGVPVESILAGLDIPKFTEDELAGAAIVDAIVIFRYQAPDWPVPRLTYVKSRDMGDELSVGCVKNVLDHMGACILTNWNED